VRCDVDSFEIRSRGELLDGPTSVVALEIGRASGLSSGSSVRLVRRSTVGARLNRLGIDGPVGVCVGVLDSRAWPRWPLTPFRLRMLVLLASNRLMTLIFGVLCSAGS